MSEQVRIEFETSSSTEKLDAAMAKAQGEISGATKDKVNPAFRSKYADLASIWDACRGPLSKNGLSVTQWPVHSIDGRAHVFTRVACAGEWIMAHSSVPVSKPDAHGYGSATTYAKRFAFSAITGCVGEDEDDDGNAASAKEMPPAKTSRAEQTKATIIANAKRASPTQEEPPPDMSPPPDFEDELFHPETGELLPAKQPEPKKTKPPAPNGMSIPFGKHKGRAVNDPKIPAEDLKWLHGVVMESVRDQKKARFKDQNQGLADALANELETR